MKQNWNLEYIIPAYNLRLSIATLFKLSMWIILVLLDDIYSMQMQVCNHGFKLQSMILAARAEKFTFGNKYRKSCS